MSPVVRVRAYAKINLGLEVLGQRPDGLHEVRTILQTIDLADALRFELSASVALRLRGMEARPDNLILQAAHLLKERAGVGEGCLIRCIKRIPVAGGLGGGSADAAATLCALWSLWSLRHDSDTRADLAATLGADVPFLLRGGTALASGTGRRLVWLADAPRHWVVLVPLSAGPGPKTAQMYAGLAPADFSDGSRVERQAAAIRNGHLDYGALGNAFEPAARACWPTTALALDLLRQSGADATLLAGSGPSVVGLYRRRSQALATLEQLRAQGLTPRLHRFTGPRECQPAPL